MCTCDSTGLQESPCCSSTLQAAQFPLSHSLHTPAGEEEQPADWRHQGFKSFGTFPPRLGLKRDVPVTLRDQVRGMRELDRHCLLRRSLSQALKSRKALMSSQELVRTQTEAESWELNLLVSQGTALGTCRPSHSSKLTCPCKAKGPRAAWNGGWSSVY